MSKNKSYVVGIDEAGRGPLAGPVAVGIVLTPKHFDWSLLPGVGDSKKVSEKNRERIYIEAMKLTKAGELWCTVEMASAKAIDTQGIAVVIRECIDKGLSSVLADCNDTIHTPIDWSMVEVKLDGSLRAPEYCVNQETIIKGDSKELSIGLASILAKVTRDAYMCKLATKPAFAPYYFAQHKGYGTAAHRRVIRAQGLSSEHRKSYCRNLKPVV
ncbi:MAG: ribonuclease HII [Candidatus Pacebacteria bacterium]|jgi:ribonuclease HII|nr:ribonuclease HII [Candidatus Paceibacterota bacterium]